VTGTQVDPWIIELDSVLARVRPSPKGRTTWDTATLAAWRRGLGKPPMAVPVLWPDIIAVRDKVPARNEWTARRVEETVHHILALYAFHQQSREQPMHDRSPIGETAGRSLGRSCRNLRQAMEKRDRTPEGVQRAFYAASTAESLDELIGHLRRLIPLLREYDIPIDYALLARDMTWWPDPERRAWARRRWGLDYLSARSDEDEATKETSQ
jgi:CRISPR system Cascade subunit CasB